MKKFRIRNKRADRARFTATANRTKSVNLLSTVRRGGIRM